MRRLTAILLSWGLAAGFYWAECVAQDNPVLSARHHPWGRFQPGAWKLVRVVTESLDDKGTVLGTSVTETKTTLAKIEDDGVTLEVEVGVEVAGKQFDGQPQCIKQGFHGELATPDLVVHAPKQGEVAVENGRMPCRIQQVDFAGSSSKTLTYIYYVDSISPYVLRRESTTSDADGKVVGETNLEVVALDMPFKVLSEVKAVACIRTVQRHARGTVTTVAMTSAAVPGGVVYHTSKEVDINGRLVRRSTLELISYGLQEEQERQGIFGRKRPPRHRKPSTHGPAW